MVGWSCSNSVNPVSDRQRFRWWDAAFLDDSSMFSLLQARKQRLWLRFGPCVLLYGRCTENGDDLLDGGSCIDDGIGTNATRGSTTVLAHYYQALVIFLVLTAVRSPHLSLSRVLRGDGTDVRKRLHRVLPLWGHRVTEGLEELIPAKQPDPQRGSFIQGPKVSVSLEFRADETEDMLSHHVSNGREQSIDAQATRLAGPEGQCPLGTLHLLERDTRYHWQPICAAKASDSLVEVMLQLPVCLRLVPASLIISPVINPPQPQIIMHSAHSARKSRIGVTSCSRNQGRT